MSWIFIEPSDVWFFRDGRPFNAGESHAVRSLFPPAPYTVQGALRALILGHADVPFGAFARQDTADARALGRQIGYPADRAGRAAGLGAFRMRGPFPARLADGALELLTPLPADAGYRDDGTWQALRPRRAPFGPATNDPATALHPLLPADPARHVETPPKESGYLDAGGLAGYLSGGQFGVAERTAVHLVEPRLGIAIDYGRGRAQDQMLYNAEFIRLREDGGPFGLAVQLDDGVTLPAPDGLLLLGGEARAAHYRTLDAPAPALPAAATRAKLLLQTPAWFSGGWQPAGGDWAAFFGAPAGTVRLISVAVARPLYLGGWDVANGRPKPLRAFLPPASVYYFESDDPLPWPAAFTETPDGDLDLPAQGFGAYAGATWTWAT